RTSFEGRQLEIDETTFRSQDQHPRRAPARLDRGFGPWVGDKDLPERRLGTEDIFGEGSKAIEELDPWVDRIARLLQAEAKLRADLRGTQSLCRPKALLDTSGVEEPEPLNPERGCLLEDLRQCRWSRQRDGEGHRRCR